MALLASGADSDGSKIELASQNEKCPTRKRIGLGTTLYLNKQ